MTQIQKKYYFRFKPEVHISIIVNKCKLLYLQTKLEMREYWISEICFRFLSRLDFWLLPKTCSQRLNGVWLNLGFWLRRLNGSILQIGCTWSRCLSSSREPYQFKLSTSKRPKSPKFHSCPRLYSKVSGRLWSLELGYPTPRSHFRSKSSQISWNENFQVNTYEMRNF